MSMAQNLLAAAILNGLSFLVHAGGLMVLTILVDVMHAHPRLRDRRPAAILTLSAVAFGMFCVVCVEVGVWATGLLAVGAFRDFETAFYFSTSSFATIGFGDVAPVPRWRLLASMEGITGFLIIGWSAAYLVAAGIRYGPFERDKHF